MVESGFGIRCGLHTFFIYDCCGNWPAYGDAQVWEWGVSLVHSVLPGFAPVVEPLLFRQKWPKPVTPRPGTLRWVGRKTAEGGPTRLAQTRSARG